MSVPGAVGPRILRAYRVDSGYRVDPVPPGPPIHPRTRIHPVIRPADVSLGSGEPAVTHAGQAGRMKRGNARVSCGHAGPGGYWLRAVRAAAMRRIARSRA